METSISLIRGSPGNSSENTSGNSLTVGISANSMLPLFNSLTLDNHARHPFLINFSVVMTEIIEFGTTLLSPLNTTFFSPSPWITTVLVKQSTCALCLLSQSIPRIKS